MRDHEDRWSWTLAVVRGIPIRLHPTFLVIPLLAALGFGRAHGGDGALFGVLLALLLFTSVALHELGHSLVAQRFGVAVRDITLYPIGGVAALASQPRSPRHELWIALAGPAVNVVIAAVVFALSWAVGLELPASTGGAPSLGTAARWIVGSNLALAAFNMVPALPMDGGRVLRALLELRLGRGRATRIAARLATVIAFLMGAWALLTGQLFLGLIALMVFFGARSEVQHDERRSVLATRTAGTLYNEGCATLLPGDDVRTVIDHLLTSPQADFAVLLGGRLLGVVGRDAVIAALEAKERPRWVAELMDREPLRALAEVPGDELRERMLAEGRRVAAIFDGEQFLGLVSLEDLEEAAAVLSAARAATLVLPAPARS